MKAVVVIAFYVWLALTVAIVLGRLARWTASRSASRRRRRARLANPTSGTESVGGSTRAASGTPISITSPSVTSPSVGVSASPTRSASKLPTRMSAAPAQTNDASALEPDGPSEPDGSAASRERRHAERRRGDRRHADRRQAVTSDDDATTAASDQSPAPPTPAVDKPTIAHLLAGFAMPSDLTPITPANSDPSDQTTSLISRDSEAYEVGTNIADELERLGYVLTPVGQTALLATRDDDILTVEIDPAPNQPDSLGTRRFPTAGPTDVVVEFWAGSGPRPT